MTLEDVLWDIHKRILVLPTETRNKMPTDYSVYREEGKTVTDIVDEEYEMASDALGNVYLLKEEMLKRYGHNHIHEIDAVIMVLNEAVKNLESFSKMMGTRKRRVHQDAEVMRSFGIDEGTIQDMVSSGLINVNYEVLKRTQQALAGEEKSK